MPVAWQSALLSAEHLFDTCVGCALLLFLFCQATLSPEARQVLFEKMEVLLQETTLQNAQYKNNLQSMGQEITKLMEESDSHAQSERASSRVRTSLASDS